MPVGGQGMVSGSAGGSTGATKTGSVDNGFFANISEGFSEGAGAFLESAGQTAARALPIWAESELRDQQDSTLRNPTYIPGNERRPRIDSGLNYTWQRPPRQGQGQPRVQQAGFMGFSVPSMLTVGAVILGGILLARGV